MTTKIRYFEQSKNDYYHMMGLEDDEIYLVNKNGDIIITYDSWGNVIHNNKNIGKFALNRESCWVFLKSEQLLSIDVGLLELPIGPSINGPAEGLLDYEVQFSKLFIEQNIQDLLAK